MSTFLPPRRPRRRLGPSTSRDPDQVESPHHPTPHSRSHTTDNHPRQAKVAGAGMVRRRISNHGVAADDTREEIEYSVEVGRSAQSGRGGGRRNRSGEGGYGSLIDYGEPEREEDREYHHRQDEDPSTSRSYRTPRTHPSSSSRLVDQSYNTAQHSSETASREEEEAEEARRTEQERLEDMQGRLNELLELKEERARERRQAREARRRLEGRADYEQEGESSYKVRVHPRALTELRLSIHIYVLCYSKQPPDKPPSSPTTTTPILRTPPPTRSSPTRAPEPALTRTSTTLLAHLLRISPPMRHPPPLIGFERSDSNRDRRRSPLLNKTRLWAEIRASSEP